MRDLLTIHHLKFWIYILIMLYILSFLEAIIDCEIIVLEIYTEDDFNINKTNNIYKNQKNNEGVVEICEISNTKKVVIVKISK